MERAEDRIHEINELFCNAGFFEETPAAKVKKLENEQKQLKSKVDDLLLRWEELEAELESA